MRTRDVSQNPSSDGLSINRVRASSKWRAPRRESGPGLFLLLLLFSLKWSGGGGGGGGRASSRLPPLPSSVYTPK